MSATEAHRRLLEEIDLLWRTAQLRHTKLDPLDEVRTAMAAFDETLFRTVPRVYRSLDGALAEGSRNARARGQGRSSATGAGSAATATATPT